MEQPLSQLRIEPWPEPVIDRLGFPPHSPYLQLWLPVVGPSVSWAWRLVASRLEHEPDGFDLDLVETARLLGLGAGTARNSAMWRTLQRATRFELAQWRGEDVLAVRLRIPPLPRRHLLRLPPVAQRAHHVWMARQARAADAPVRVR